MTNRVERMKKSKKDIAFGVIFAFCFFFFLAQGFYNFEKISHLEKYGIEQKAVVDSFSLKEFRLGKGGTTYTAKIEYHLYGEEEKNTCIFEHFPSEEYPDGSIFYLLTDTERNFSIPVNEIPSAKRVNVTGNFMYALLLLIFFGIKYFVGILFEKSELKHRTRKKRWKKNPELRTKEEKVESIKGKLAFLLILPFILIDIGLKRLFGKKQERKFKTLKKKRKHT